MSTNAELIERLRKWLACPNPFDTAQEAADRIAKLGGLTENLWRSLKITTKERDAAKAERDRLRGKMMEIYRCNDASLDPLVAAEIGAILDSALSPAKPRGGAA